MYRLSRGRQNLFDTRCAVGILVGAYRGGGPQKDDVHKPYGDLPLLTDSVRIAKCASHLPAGLVHHLVWGVLEDVPGLPRRYTHLLPGLRVSPLSHRSHSESSGGIQRQVELEEELFFRKEVQ